MSDEVLWTAPNGTVYRRTGSCPPERCRGRCCEFMTFGPFRYSEKPEGDKQWADVRGITMIDAGNRMFFVNVPMACPALDEGGLCSLYDGPREIQGIERTRPEACSDWPQSPIDLSQTPWCGYSFEPVEEAAPVAAQR